MTKLAITGVSGFLGRGLLRRLVASGHEAFVGLDVRVPEFRPRQLQHHLVDIAGSELKPLLEGVDTLVHLAGVHDATPDLALMARVNVAGTRNVLDAAASVGVRKIVLVSSATVYGAWANNPIPITEDAPLRPHPGFPLAVHKAEQERLLAEWAADAPDRVPTVLRPAFILGPGADHVVARLLQARLPLAVAGAGAPVQFLHEDDAIAALALAVESDLPGAYNVAADGWLARESLRPLLGRKVQPAVGPEVLERVLRRLWPAGLVDLHPGIVPYLVHPWVIAVDRLRSQGWSPTHSNEEAVLACSEGHPGSGVPRGPLAAAAVAAGIGLVVVKAARRGSTPRRG